MVEIIEMGATPIIEKVITPTFKPVVGALPPSKSSSGLIWIVLFIIVVIAGLIIYQSLKEDSKELEASNVPNEDLD